MNNQVLWTLEFLGMSASSFFQYMAHYALIAALPVVVTGQLGGNEWQAGLVMTFFQIGAVLFRPLAGKWIDQFDKKGMLFAVLAVFFAVSLMYLGVTGLGLYFLLLIRFLHGGVFAVGSTAVAATAALIVPEQRKGEGIGYFAMFSTLAMVVGPFFSLTLISHYTPEVLFASVVALAALAFWTANRNTLDGLAGKGKKPGGRSLRWHDFIEARALPVAFIGGLLFFAYAGVLVFVPIYARLLELTQYTSLFFAVYALSIVITRPLVGQLFDRAGMHMVVYPGIMLFVLGLVCLSQVQGAAGFLIAAAIIGVGFGALSPTFQALAVQVSPSRRAGVATSTYFLALDISVGMGSFFLSFLAAGTGYRSMYLCTAVVVGLAAVAYYTLRRRLVSRGGSAALR